MAPPAILPHALIASRYEILQPLGAGGMGMVFKAHDRRLDETVAVKILHTAAGAARDMVSRFRSEVKLAWKVKHKNVCGIHEYGEDGDLLYFTMELVEGQDLKHLLREKGALDWEEAYEIAVQAAEGLQAIHDAGVIHRDLKAANIMRDGRGLVRLMDFGIARVFGEETPTGITMTGQVVGSPEYMSPEQVRAQRLDLRSDIYALGIVIFEMFTGRVPFRAETPLATMLKHLQDPPPLTGPQAARLPAALIVVLGKALAKDPHRRYQSCSEVIAALREARAALEHQVTDRVPPGPGAPVAVESATPPTKVVRPSMPARSYPPPPEARLLAPFLVKAMGHADAGVRVRAAEELARIGPMARAAVPRLIEALVGDESADVRLQAVQALGAMGGEGVEAIRALREAQEDQDQRVRAAAVEALGRLSPSGEIPAPGSAAAVGPAPSPPAPRPRDDGRLPAASASEPVEGFQTRSRERSHGVVIPATAQRRRSAWLVAAIGIAVVGVGVALYRFSPSSNGPASSPIPSPSATPTTESLPSGSLLSPPTTTVSVAPPTSKVGRPARTSSPSDQPTEVSPKPTVVAPPPLVPSPPPFTDLPPATTSPPSSPASPTLPPTPAPTPTPAIVPPKCLQCPPIEYPLFAQRMRIEGTVVLRLRINESGNVAKVEVVQGVEHLSEAAIKGVKKWKYRPATSNGVPIPEWIESRCEFKLAP